MVQFDKIKFCNGFLWVGVVFFIFGAGTTAVDALSADEVITLTN